MKSTLRIRAALLAAASLTAATAAVARADEAAPIEPVATERLVTATGHDAERPNRAGAIQKLGLAALAAAALARLIGFRRIRAVAAKTVEMAGTAASAGVAAAASAARMVGRAISSPLRFAALFGGVALVALTGVGLYDVEWAGGLFFGALFATTIFWGVLRARTVFRRMLPPSPLTSD